MIEWSSEEETFMQYFFIFHLFTISVVRLKSNIYCLTSDIIATFAIIKKRKDNTQWKRRSWEWQATMPAIL
jgi:hypothetical protein